MTTIPNHGKIVVFNVVLFGLLLLNNSVCLSTGGHFLEGTEVLEQKERGIAGTWAVQVPVRMEPKGPEVILPSVLFGFRSGFGIGARQELRLEAHLSPFLPVLAGRLSWKAQLADFVAVTTGVWAGGGFVIFNSAGFFFGGDIGFLLSTGVARPITGRRFRPYCGLRIGIGFPLYCLMDSCETRLLPMGALGFRYAINNGNAFRLEIGYTGAWTVEKINDGLQVLLESAPKHAGPVHGAFIGAGFDWTWNGTVHRAEKAARQLQEVLDRTIKDADAAMDHGDYDAAVGLFERAFGLRDQAWILCNIGEAYRRKLEWSAARQAFQRCLDRDPQAHYAEAVKHILAELPEVTK
jgi:hypothetical protein